MSEQSMLYCLLCFILGCMVNKLMMGNGFSVGVADRPGTCNFALKKLCKGTLTNVNKCMECTDENRDVLHKNQCTDEYLKNFCPSNNKLHKAICSRNIHTQVYYRYKKCVIEPNNVGKRIHYPKDRRHPFAPVKRPFTCESIDSEKDRWRSYMKLYKNCRLARTGGHIYSPEDWPYVSAEQRKRAEGR